MGNSNFNAKQVPESDRNKELGENFKVHQNIRTAIFLRFSWQDFWKIFSLNKEHKNLYNTRYFWSEKAIVDILNYFDKYPNRWNLDYSRITISEKFDEILLSLDLSVNSSQQNSSLVSGLIEEKITSPKKYLSIYDTKSKYLVAYLVLTNLYDINSNLLVGTYKNVWNYRHKNYYNIDTSFLRLRLADDNIITRPNNINEDLVCIILAYFLYPDNKLLKERLENLSEGISRQICANFIKTITNYGIYLKMTSDIPLEDKISYIFGDINYKYSEMTYYLLFRLYNRNITDYPSFFVISHKKDITDYPPLFVILNNILNNENKIIRDKYLSNEIIIDNIMDMKNNNRVNQISNVYPGPEYMIKLILWHYAERNQNIPQEYLPYFKGFSCINEFVLAIAPSIFYIQENAKLRYQLLFMGNCVSCAGPVLEYIFKTCPPIYENFRYENIVINYLNWKYGTRQTY